LSNFSKIIQRIPNPNKKRTNMEINFKSNDEILYETQTGLCYEELLDEEEIEIIECGF
jgi:hypothetical protein